MAQTETLAFSFMKSSCYSELDFDFLASGQP